MLDRLFNAIGRGIEKAVEDTLIDALKGAGGKVGGRKGCVKAWLREFRERPGGVHLIIGRQRSGKTALCYFLAQITGRKVIYAITAAKEVLPDVYVIQDVDLVPSGGICVIDDASMFFNSMRTGNNEEDYMLLRDLLLISEKQDICFIFNTHDSSLLHSTVLGQCRTLIFKEPNLMFEGTERPAIRKIMEYAQNGFGRIPKTRRNSYFFLYTTDCTGWGKAPLPAGWNQKVSTSVVFDAEFRDLKDEKEEPDGKDEKREGDTAESEEFRKFQEHKKQTKDARKKEKELKEFEEWRKAGETGKSRETFEDFKKAHERKNDETEKRD